MGRFFDMDSPLFVALTRVADLMILNVVFILTCIPVFTIGAACTAMSYVTLKMVKNEETYIVKGYWKSFKENFKQATAIWLIVLVLVGVLFIDFRILSNMTGFASKMRIPLLAVVLFLAMTYIYIFPVLSRFVNNIVNTVKNSFIMAVVHFPTTVILLVIDVAFIGIPLVSNITFVWGTLFWIMAGFSTVSYLNSKFLVKVFEKYMPKEEEEEKKASVTGTQVYEMSGFTNLQPQPFEEDEEE